MPTGELLGIEYLHGQTGKLINLEDDEDAEVGDDLAEAEDPYQALLDDPTLLAEEDLGFAPDICFVSNVPAATPSLTPGNEFPLTL